MGYGRGYYGRGYGYRGYGYGYPRYGYYGHYLGKRSAEADAEPGYGYYGRGFGYYGSPPFFERKIPSFFQCAPRPTTVTIILVSDLRVLYCNKEGIFLKKKKKKKKKKKS